MKQKKKNIVFGLLLMGAVASFIVGCESDGDAPSLAIPSLQTDEKQNPVIGEKSAALSGRIWKDGGSPIVESGIVWAVKTTTKNDEVQFPDKGNANTVISDNEETMLIKVTIQDLPIVDTVYFARTYAINKDGHIGYSYPYSFTNDLTKHNFKD